MTPLIWAAREQREGPCDSPHSLLPSREVAAERETVAMTTCWQLLSLCLESTGCSLHTQRLGGRRGEGAEGPGGDERKGGVGWEGSSCQRGTRQDLATTKLKGRKKSNKSVSQPYTYSQRLGLMTGLIVGDGEEWQWIIALVIPHISGVFIAG